MMVGNCILFFYFEMITCVSTHVPLWSYDDENSWPGAQCRVGGSRQSPIDIRTSRVITDYREEFIKHGPLLLTAYDNVLVSGINNGHTIQFSSEGEEAIHPVLTGGPLKHKYRLEQVHFHWISEHSVNGAKFAMEIHLVHVRTDLTVTKALDEKDGLAIIAIFCSVKTELDEKEQLVSYEFMQHIPHLLQTGDRISGVLLDMTKLLIPIKNSYYTYAGSLTSPECNEAVIWILLSNPIHISDAEYRLFGKVGIGRHNFRSLQPSDQTIYKPPNSYAETPIIVDMLSSFFGTINRFFRNVTRFVGKTFRHVG